MKKRNHLMGLNEPCKGGGQGEGEPKEPSGAPRPFRHGLLALVNVTRGKGRRERGEH